MSEDPRKVRQIHFKRGSLAGVIQGECQLDEQSLTRDATVRLEPALTLNEQGEEVPGPGEPEELQVELKAIMIN